MDRDESSGSQQELIGVAGRDEEVVRLIVQGGCPARDRVGAADEQDRHVGARGVPVEGRVDGDDVEQGPFVRDGQRIAFLQHEGNRMSPLQGVDESLGLGGRQTDEGDGFSGEGFDVGLPGLYHELSLLLPAVSAGRASIFMPRLLKAALLVAGGAVFYVAIAAFWEAPAGAATGAGTGPELQSVGPMAFGADGTPRSLMGRGARVDTVTDMALVDGRLWVAGLSNEEFSSKLRAIPYPFERVDGGVSVEIYHGSHGAYETRSPVYTFVPYAIAGEPHLIAGYLCTPLVTFSMAAL